VAGGPTRSDTWEITVQIQNILHPQRIMLDTGVWDKKEGGQVDSEETKYPPGGMKPEVSLGGRQTVENVTLRRLYRLVRDHQDLSRVLIAGAGKARVTVAQQPLDIEGNVFGRPIVWSGILKRAAFPDVDSENSDAALVELEITPDGPPTA